MLVQTDLRAGGGRCSCGFTFIDASGWNNHILNVNLQVNVFGDNEHEVEQES
jgi:hypothetical protein